MVVFVEERRSHLLELHGPTIELFGQLAVPLDSRPEVRFLVILHDLRSFAVFLVVRTASDEYSRGISERDSEVPIGARPFLFLISTLLPNYPLVLKV